MIEILQSMARLLGRIRVLLLLLALIFFATFSATLFELTGGDDRMLIPSLVGFAWAVTLLSFAGLFHRVPPKPDPAAGFLRRLRMRLRRAGIWLMALLMLGLTVALMMLSSQLYRAWS